MRRHIIGVAREVALFQSEPGLQGIHQLLQELRQEVAGIRVQLNDIQASLRRIPMQLYNAAASLDSTILYPPDIRHARFLPSTKRKLRKLTVTSCNRTIAHLGLPRAARGASVEQRRQIIMDYLGCGMQVQA